MDDQIQYSSENQPNTNKSVIAVVISVVITTILVGGSIFLWQQKRLNKIEDDSSQQLVALIQQAITLQQQINQQIEDDKNITDDWLNYTYASSESDILPSINFRYPSYLGENPKISSRKTNIPEVITDDWAGFVEFNPDGKLGNGLRLEFFRKTNTENNFENYVKKQAGLDWDDIKYFQVNNNNAARMRFSLPSDYDADVGWYFLEMPNNNILSVSTIGNKSLLYDDKDGFSTRDKIFSTFKFIEEDDENFENASPNQSISFKLCIDSLYSDDIEKYNFWEATFILLHPQLKIYDAGSYCDLTDGTKLVSFSHFASSDSISAGQTIILFDSDNNVIKETEDFYCQTIGDLGTPRFDSIDNGIVQLSCNSGDGPVALHQFYELNLDDFSYIFLRKETETFQL